MDAAWTAIQGQEMPPSEADAPRRTPAFNIRTVLFRLDDTTLQVALRDTSREPSLPAGEPEPGEALDVAARRAVQNTVGLQEHYLEQLYTLSVANRDGWTIITSYLGVSCPSTVPASADQRNGVWYDVTALPALSETDQMVIRYALMRLRAKIGYTTIAFHLLPSTFTVRELQQAYETILNRPLDKRNFRRRVISAGMLSSTGTKRRDGSHRPALLYRFRAGHDPESYLTPPWSAES